MSVFSAIYKYVRENDLDCILDTPVEVRRELYAAYHLPVVWNFLPLALVLGCGVGLTLLGLALQRVVERLGLIVAIVAHGACDAVVSVIVADVVWSWGLAERTRRR